MKSLLAAWDSADAVKAIGRTESARSWLAAFDSPPQEQGDASHSAAFDRAAEVGLGLPVPRGCFSHCMLYAGEDYIARRIMA